MKNPWMSAWLSEANRYANAAKGHTMAEVSRQQQAMMQAWTEQATRMWMQIWFPWLPAKKRKR